ncbi:efflux transporter outer membrane subunit [Comamonas composti]|uniref:efflux transporter outer membrane subunit n=1 Tax=Comamonas composti TaxID=408558 RepID=UPI000400E5FC|nr:efflux transporter outer membrane subunit [Comamonas composti]
MKAIVLCSILALSLAGCAGMDGLDKAPRATLNTPTAIGAKESAPSQWPSDRWWESYQDPALNRLIERALAQSPDLRIAGARLARAAALAEQAGAQRWPTMDMDASGVRKRYAQQYDADAPLAGHHGTTLTLGAEIQYTFDFWGGQRAALKSALGETAARSAEVQAARVLLTSRLANAWFELAQLIALRDLAQEALTIRSHTLRIVERRTQAGLATEVDRKQAQGDLPATEREIFSLDEQIALQRHALAALAGLPVDALSDAMPSLSAVPDSEFPAAVPAALIGHRPDVVAARWRVEAAAQEMEVAKAGFYPNISLRAFAGFARQGLSVGLSDWLTAGSRTYGVAPAITLPIFDAGRLRARFKGSAAELDAAIETYNQTLLAAVRDVADQLVSLDGLVPQSNAQAQTLAARQAAFALARRQYEAGLTDYLTVLNAQNALLRERQQQLALKTRELVLGVELNRALGGGFDAASTTTNLAWKHQ